MLQSYVKEFKPYYFAVPTHIFNETHYIESLTFPPSLNNHRLEFNRDLFETSANIKLEYHKLGLECASNRMRALTRVDCNNPLVIEYKSSQNLKFSHDLIDNESGEEIKNALLIQTQHPNESEQFFKYCLVGEIPQIGKDYLVRLFALSKDTNLTKGRFELITEFHVIRQQNDLINENQHVPNYQLSFEHEIRLKSHQTQRIVFDSNPLEMVFRVRDDIKFDLELKDAQTNDSIPNSVLVHKDPISSDMIVNVAVPRENQRFVLNIFASEDSKTSILRSIEAEFHLIRSKRSKNDDLKFCGMYAMGRRCFISSPREYHLHRGRCYMFKYCVKDAVDVALVFDGNEKWIGLEKRENESNGMVNWCKNVMIERNARVQVFAKFSQNDEYNGICFYDVID